MSKSASRPSRRSEPAPARRQPDPAGTVDGPTPDEQARPAADDRPTDEASGAAPRRRGEADRADSGDGADGAAAPGSDEPTAPAQDGTEDAASTPAAPHESPLWPAERTEAFTRQWREAQIAFVDDPAAAVRTGRTLLTDALRELTDALTGTAEGTDTEQLRLQMRRYRATLERLTAL